VLRPYSMAPRAFSVFSCRLDTATLPTRSNIAPMNSVSRSGCMCHSAGCHAHLLWTDDTPVFRVERSDAAVWHRRAAVNAMTRGSPTTTGGQSGVMPARDGLHPARITTGSMPEGQGQCNSGGRTAVRYGTRLGAWWPRPWPRPGEP